MVVNDLDLPGVARAPDKTDTPLVVYTQAIPSSPIAPQCFQSIAGWYPQVIKLNGGLNRQKRRPRPALNLHG